MPNPLSWIDDELQTLDAGGLRRHLSQRSSTQAATIEIDGRQLINFGANDYLGLAADVLNDVTRQAINEFGWGSGASPLVSGRGRKHAELEEALAEFEGTEAALLFSSGYAANVGAITAVAGKGDVIFSDAKNHASIIDSCRLSSARVQIYPHRDVDYLRMMLPQAGGFRRRLIVTDSLFSMDGDLAPLADLAALAEEFRCMLMVDEAHATGVFGETGRGVSEYWNVESGVHIRVGTLSKALGSIGGFVSGSQQLVDWIANRARTYIFSTAAPQAIAVAGLAALENVRSEPHRRIELLARAGELRQELHALGLDIGGSESQIIPIFLGDLTRTMLAVTTLGERGLFVPGIRPPSVPEGESLLRISLSYAHTPEMLGQLVDELERAVGNVQGT
ncbi:MAG: 8-amino-7-oxononanoate synthase [Planctomycetaceae bacterium]|nr:8-amino-7-oxononanoate synthase [Planctomycetaceae bacterium]